MHERGVPVPLRHARVDVLLDSGVREEVDGPGGCDADQVGSQPPEQTPRALGLDDVPGNSALIATDDLWLVRYTTRSRGALISDIA